MKARLRIAASAALLLLTFAACSGGSGGDAPVDFQRFVLNQITDQTSDTAEPVELNDVEFRGLTAGDPTIFDDLFDR